MSPPVAALEGATKAYGDVRAVEGATISVEGGKVVGVVGPSGSGKTTLMGMLGTLLVPTSGKAYFDGEMPVPRRRELRLRRMGFVFQQLRLMQKLSVIENVRLPLVLAGGPTAAQLQRASDLVAAVGLGGKERRRPRELSVGEQQRVAVARALVNSPALVLADEPTSQLDSATGGKVLDLLEGLCREIGAAVVISTHDQKMRDRLGEVYEMRDGVLGPG
jgi:ABC-type lipoprotein export system ATPase subunit